jgi:hypothetical protein
MCQYRKGIRLLGRTEYCQSQLCCAIYLTFLNVTCFGFFCKAVIRQYELGKERSSCAVHKVCHKRSRDLNFRGKRIRWRLK